jgi:hypothetical protein
LLPAIGAGLYFLAGAWGTALLWGYAMLFALPWLAAIIGQTFVVRARAAEREWKSCVSNAMGLGVMAAAWLSLTGYFGYRAFLAAP